MMSKFPEVIRLMVYGDQGFGFCADFEFLVPVSQSVAVSVQRLLVLEARPEPDNSRAQSHGSGPSLSVCAAGFCGVALPTRQVIRLLIFARQACS